MLKEIFEQPTAAGHHPGPHVLEEGEVFFDEINLSEEVFRRSSAGHHHRRVRNVVARGPRRQVPDRDAGARSGRSRLRLRVPLSRSDRRPENELVIVDHAVRRDRGHAGRARRKPKRKGAAILAICNVVGSMATRESDGTIYTHAGPEIGVASTKAFTSQLVALLLLALYIAPGPRAIDGDEMRAHIDALLQLPHKIEQALEREAADGAVAKSSIRARTSSSSDAASTTRSPSRARSS